MNNIVPFRLPQPVNQYVAHKESCALLKVFGMFPLPSDALTSPKVEGESGESEGEEFQEAETSSFVIFLENTNCYLHFRLR